MTPTQLDIIRRQSEAAVQNALHRTAAGVRRETSLVGQASRLAGKAASAGEGALGRRLRGWSSPERDSGGSVVKSQPIPVIPAPDRYVRRSPVQPVYEAADYRRKLALRAAGVCALLLAVCAGLSLLSRLGLLGR